MSTYKHIDRICAVIAAATLFLTVLFMNGKALGLSAAVEEAAGDGMFTENELDGDWDTSGATEIVLSDGGSTVKGNGAYVYQGDVYLVYAGRYILSGELSNGTVIVDADGDDKLWIMLDGASIHCDGDAAIRVEQADKVFLTLSEGSENTLSSGPEYGAEAVSAGVDGTIYSRDDLTINGSGTLAVTAKYQHGIVCNDDLAVTGGRISVEAAQDGIHANDSIRIRDAQISISADDDGITASNDEETSYLYIESGKIDIPACYEGLEAAAVTITGGTIDLAPSDDGINASGSGRSPVIRITGGTVTIMNPEGRDADGLDSNRDIFISGGTVFISVSGDGGNSAIDYGSENGGVCEITGGMVLACGSNTMTEGFDASSSQGFLMRGVSVTAGTVVTLETADGEKLISEEIPCSFSSLVISTPEMAVGDTCILSVGETKEEVVIGNSSEASGFAGGGRNAGERAGGMTPEEGETPPEMPDGNGGTDDEIPEAVRPEDGGMPGRENGRSDSGGLQEPAGIEPGVGMERPENSSVPVQGETSRTAGSDSALPAGTLLLLGISAGVLLFGCMAALVFKGRI